MHPSPEHAWSEICARLRRAVPEATFALWLEPLQPVEATDVALVLAAPDERRRSWASGRFGRVLEAAASDVLGPRVAVDVVVDPGTARARRSGGTAPARSRAAAAPADDPDPAPAATSTFLPKLTFEQFVIGDANRLAHAAALAVAELPGQAYNPLFIYGPPGNGKTHLLHAIGNYVQAYGGGLTVRYATAEAFTNEFVTALHRGSVEAFKARFRHVDVLLVDDVQFLVAKAKTEEEFFHTFNALHETGSQLVLTCDRMPRDLDALEDRLRERFEAGLLTDIRAPDLATRLTILRKRAHHDGVDLADDAALVAIAERITDNIRVLEGALIRVVAFASLTGRPLDADLAHEVLDGLYPQRRPVRRSIDEVQQATCEAFGISQEELLSAARAQRLAWPRQVAMYLARELTDQTLPAIGRAFGGRDHTTVMHACRRTAERIAADPEANAVVRDLTERLRGRS
ncbi:MAG TPA: chromosomal replication initiator protein DnaA [Capillimicrobium sp.]|nr:chromosomal replication initiator protein DnaA [Capillimicrobium sp.]